MDKNIDKPAISILVPIYDVERYLQRCIYSVLSQDFTDWEMILVDDGSPDRCPQICDEYASKDNRIRVIHKKNGGLVSARQAGFVQAKGEYIMHLDSDDWLMPNALTTLYNYAIEGDYDIVRGCNRRMYEDGHYTIERGRFHNGIVEGCENYLEKVINADISTYLWGAIYRRTLFTYDMFTPLLDISVGEDWLTNISVGKHAKKILCVDDIVYNYFINTQSIMQTQVCSFEYAERVRRILDSLTSNCNANIKYFVKCNRIAGFITNQFIPELSFNHRYYKEVTFFLKESKLNKEKLLDFIDSKYLKFIKYRFLFIIYSRAYAILYRYIKLHGKKRQVLK